MGNGYLVIQLSNALKATPVIEAEISIMNKNNEKIVYKKDGELNLSGKTGPIMLEAPNKKFSLDVNSEVIPYESYDIEVVAKGYENVKIEGVPIFDGITSIQEIEVNTNGSKIFKKMPNNIVIPKHQLLLNERRNYKDLESEEILPLKSFKKVYIPENIVVHLGEANSNAEDVIVRFVDYIKNVCASEIYPTWSEEAIKANVYAQISFVLNLVYLEWYGRKGYPFQVTNYLNDDLAFVYGRNTYDTTNVIVEDIFNEYISLVNNNKPYLAQYCSGIAYECKGLSKWGSQLMANNGYKALDIIQKYYGIDKIIKSTSLVEGIPEYYPGYELRVNDDNQNVKIIQIYLNIINKVYKEIPTIELVNGVFGKETENAVKSFQGIFNLFMDGIVGKSTWYKISEVYIAITRLSDLKMEAGLNTDLTNNFIGKYPGHIIEYGSNGEYVREIQIYLQKISRYYDIPSSLVDGSFGSYTLLSIIEFQKMFGLTPDGLLDLATWNKIYEVYCTLPKDNKFNGIYPEKVLQYGDIGDKVFELQFYLNEISNYNAIPTLKLTGKFDEDTVKAVKEFQRLFKFDPNGIVDLFIWNKIYEVYSDYPNSINNIDILEYPGYVLKLGVKGEGIRNLKTILNNIGNLYKRIGKISVNDLFDDETKKTVIEFQKYFNLKESGEVDINTWGTMVYIYKELSIRENIEKPKYYYKFPGVIFKRGDNSGYVAIIKEYINVLSKNGYNLDELFVDSIFDEKTEKEVMKFQNISGIKANGEVDNETWNKLSMLYVEFYSGMKLRSLKKYRKKRK